MLVLPRASAFELREIRVVCGEDEVELGEVARVYLSRPEAAQIISAQACVFDRAGVGGGPDVIVLCAI